MIECLIFFADYNNKIEGISCELPSVPRESDFINPKDLNLIKLCDYSDFIYVYDVVFTPNEDVVLINYIKYQDSVEL